MTRTERVDGAPRTMGMALKAQLLERAAFRRGPAALAALLNYYAGSSGAERTSQVSHCASHAIDLRVRRAASLLLDPQRPDRLKTILQLVPKTILHVHLDGSARPQTVYDLAQQKGIDLRKVQPALPENYTVDDLKKFMAIQPGERVADFWTFLLRAFELPLAVMQDKEGIERIAEEMIEQASQDGALHVEVRFAPCVHLRGGLSYEEVVEAVVRGLMRGAKKHRVSFTAVPAIYRDKIDERFSGEYKDSPAETASAAINVYQKHRGRVPLAFDLVGFETPYPPEKFREYFNRVHEAGLPITMHAGENRGTEQNILTAVRELHAQRVGHGIHALELGEEEQQELIRRGVALEVCPTMNVQLECIEGEELKDHPVMKLIQRGFRVTISPDNMTIAGVTASDELLNLHQSLGLPLFQDGGLSVPLLSLTSQSAEAAFVGPLTRQGLRQEFLRYYQALNQLLRLTSLA